MGTDIHGMIEVFNGHRWRTKVIFYDLDRNYFLFAHLAGVRSTKDGQNIIEPRGLPEDLDRGPIVVYDFGFGDHSFSWLTTEELKAVRDKMRITGMETSELRPKWDSRDLNAIIAFMENYEQVRFVFGFDN